jgi:type VI protein secretion system component Hcp
MEGDMLLIIIYVLDGTSIHDIKRQTISDRRSDGTAIRIEKIALLYKKIRGESNLANF